MSSPEVCPICVILVTKEDKGIQCDGKCDRWFHVSCTSLTQSEYAKLARDDSRKWSCMRDDCINIVKQPMNMMLNQLTKLTDTITDLAKKVDTLTLIPGKIDQIILQVDDLNNNLMSLEKRVSDNETKMNNLEDSVKRMSSPTNGIQPEDMIAEIGERARRAFNVMVYELPESASTNVETRKNYDLDLIVHLFRCSKPDFDITGVKTYRVGKKLVGKIRPLKVILKNEQDARLIVSKFSSEAATNASITFSSVKVSRDKTPLEQKYFKNLVAELEERKSRGESNLTIKFRNNIPFIVNIPKND